MMTDLPISAHKRDDFVPLTLFGKDHWSTFAYIECRLVDNGGFMLACDARMRTLGHNHRIFRHNPADNLQKVGSRQAMLGPRGDHAVNLGTRLKDGFLARHDDWDCIQDLAHAGLLLGDATEVPLRYLDALSLEGEDGKIVAADDYAARLKIAEFVREQTDFGLDVGARIYFTAEGFKCAAALRRHKANGFHFHQFRWPNVPSPSDLKLENA
jgi:hypothetical protein